MQNWSYDCIVVGGGHAGVEASSVCARLGLRTLLLTFNLDTIGQMSCNPSIGGIGKGQIVREIDALGGLMATLIDLSGIHFQMLNRSKGPAVWAPRAQAEKKAYQNLAKATLEKTPHLSFYQDECASLVREDGRVIGVRTSRGREIRSPRVILTTGTFLGAKIHIGEWQNKSGRVAEPAAHALAQDLLSTGMQTAYLKTGTPPRILRKHIDFDRLQMQLPEENPPPFSFTWKLQNQQKPPNPNPPTKSAEAEASLVPAAANVLLDYLYQ